MRTLLDNMVRPFGLRVVKAPRKGNLLYQHNYAGGYEEYRVTQIEHNRRKLDKVWADGTTLSAIVDDLRGTGLVSLECAMARATDLRSHGCVVR